MMKPRHKAPSATKRARSAGGADEGDREDKGLWSSRGKTEVVLRIFRGETLDALSREFDITPGKSRSLEPWWRDEALARLERCSMEEGEVRQGQAILPRRRDPRWHLKAVHRSRGGRERHQAGPAAHDRLVRLVAVHDQRLVGPADCEEQMH